MTAAMKLMPALTGPSSRERATAKSQLTHDLRCRRRILLPGDYLSPSGVKGAQ